MCTDGGRSEIKSLKRSRFVAKQLEKKTIRQQNGKPTHSEDEEVDHFSLLDSCYSSSQDMAG